MYSLKIDFYIYHLLKLHPLAMDRLTPELLQEIKQVQESRFDLLLPVVYTNETHKDVWNKLCDVLTLSFDIPENLKKLVYNCGDRDLLWVPKVNGYTEYNYYQLASLDEKGSRTGWPSIFLSYLFTNSSLIYNDPYGFSKEEKRDRKLFYEHLKSKYTDEKQYLQRVKCMLFNNDDVFDCEEVIKKKVFTK